MRLMFCIEFPKRRLQLVFEMRSLWVFDLDSGIEAKWFIFRYDLHCFKFFLFVSWTLLGVGKDLLQHIVLFDNRKCLFIIYRSELLEVADQEILLIVLE